MKYTKDMTKDLSEIVGRVNRGEGSIGKLLTNDDLYNNATRLTQTADESLKNITDELNKVTGLFDTLGVGVKTVVQSTNNVVMDVDNIIKGVKQGKGVIGALLVSGKYDSTIAGTLVNIQKTSVDARLAASRLAENMEALKHNWLFKGYFEQRGYWDKVKFEDDLDVRIKELDTKIKTLNEQINTLKSLEQTQK
jgi:phospholipid/cholesterol/gamma-HCH transport system substrate-binding protein